MDRWEVKSAAGVLWLVHTRSAVKPGPHWDPAPRFRIQSAEVIEEARGWFPHRPFYLRNTYVEPTKTSNHLSWYAYWFLLVLYVVPWTSLICFRQWRKGGRLKP
jgi:hypothetical protein